MRMSDAQYARFLVSRGKPASAPSEAVNVSPVATVPQPKRYKQGVMNRTEGEYAQKFLDPRLVVKEIKGYWFEKLTLRLGYRTSYTPDFFVERTDGTFEFHEIKGGFMRDDALAKFKIAASTFPFRFFLCQKVKGNWTVKEF